MRNIYILILFSFGFGVQNNFAEQINDNDKGKPGFITIKGEVPPNYTKSEIELRYFPTFIINGNKSGSDIIKTIPGKVTDGAATFCFRPSEPVFVYGPFWGNVRISYPVEPGESIEIKYENGKPIFSGNAATKFELVYLLNAVDDSLDKVAESKGFPPRWKHELQLKSLKDYFTWNEIYNTKIELFDALLNKYRNRVSKYAYNLIKEKAYCETEDKRVEKFIILESSLTREGDAIKHKFDLTNQDLCTIYDTTMKSHAANWLQYEAPLVGSPTYLYDIVKLETQRESEQFFHGRIADTSTLGNEKGQHRYVTRYHLAKKKYKGIQRNEVLAFMFYNPRGFIHEAGFIPDIEAILADYYKLPDVDPRYKEEVKIYELERRRKLKLATMADFSLTDINDKPFTKGDIKGKIAIFDFWFTGCTGCVQMAPALAKVEERFKHTPDVIFVSVSVDKEKQKWLKSVKQGKYVSPNSLHVYTGDKGSDHPLIKDYDISGYPSLLFVDAFGNLLPPAKRPDADNGRSMIALIENGLVGMKDGPYVFEENGTKMAFSVNGTELSKSEAGILTVQTDQIGKTFTVPLQQELSIQPSVSIRPEKLIALSDIEGNFDKFRMLLQNNKIIDENYNWIFGNGHLVFAGDMFDRGEQVTECLWLIYSLEEKAKAAGGYVHFIMGNHEIMNMQGNFKYVQEKYKNSANIIGKTLIQLYAENTELGKWLRTKNVAEKIGDLLFTHGGFSSKINQSSMTIADINNLARPYYDNNLGEGKYPDANTNTVMSQTYGPFWYRGYYVDEDKRQRVRPIVDSILNKYNAKHIITGHTIIADKITTLYDNKVINTDVKHKDGQSEALLIEGSKFYRVNYKGERWLLFDDEAPKPKTISMTTSR